MIMTSGKLNSPRIFVVIQLLILASTNGQLIPHRSSTKFAFTNKVLLKDLSEASSQSGYRLDAQLHLSSVFSSQDKQQLLHIRLTNLQLSKSTPIRFSDSPNNFEKSTSILDSRSQLESYAVLENNKIIKFLSKNDADYSLENLEKAVASLLQFQYESGVVLEDDLSGKCSVIYQAKTSTKFEKFKRDCSNWALKVHERSEKLLGNNVMSSHKTVIHLTQDGRLNKVESTEEHLIELRQTKTSGTKITSIIRLESDGIVSEVAQVTAPSLDAALATLSGFDENSIHGDLYGDLGYKSKSLKKLIKVYSEKLNESFIGDSNTASLFLELVPVARQTKIEEFLQILKARTTQTFRSQILDLLAAAQTEAAYKAVRQTFDVKNEEDFPYLDRFLQALAVGTRPNERNLKDLLILASDTSLQNEKLKQTLIQTAGSMAAQLARLSNLEYKNPTVTAVDNHLTIQLKDCKTSDCKLLYIRGLHNLRSERSVQLLLDSIVKEQTTVSVSVAIMKALNNFPESYFKTDQKLMLEVIFYQLNKRYDSTVRTNALDILLRLRPSQKELTDMLNFLASPDKAFEVKTYLLQRLRMIANECLRFKSLLDGILKQNSHIRNYDVLAQKGLTTAMQRSYSQSPSFNGTLISYQEVNNGVLKQGLVDVTLTADNYKFSSLKLGLYTSGLSSFVGGNSESEEISATDEDEEPVTAGMEITVQGSYMRPLEFFNGQSELMGHVWSGTASEPTTAYQATVLLHDHEEYLILNSGVTIYLNVLGAESTHLNGQVQFSLWNRNAHCQIDKNTGLAIRGNLVLANSFARLENSFRKTQDVNISLLADIDFYSDIVLCIQLEKANSILRNTVQNSLSISGRKMEQNRVTMKYRIPGRTLALNQKNNEMCNKILN